MQLARAQANGLAVSLHRPCLPKLLPAKRPLAVPRLKQPVFRYV
jgi:hypothetical protein